MLTLTDMRAIARGRVMDAAVLIRAGRFDTAVYLCGYAVEVSLKARICRTLGWTEFPNKPGEWQPHHAFLKVHDLLRLAKWSGFEAELNRPRNRVYWVEVITWNPEARYERPGSDDAAESDAGAASHAGLGGPVEPAMIGHMRHLFGVLRERRGEWTLFAVLRRPRPALRPWAVVAAAPWLAGLKPFEDMRLILDTLDEAASPAEVAEVGGVFILTDPAEIVAAAQTLLAGRPIDSPVGLVRRSHFDFRSRAIRRGYVWAANLPVASAAAAAAPAA